MIKKHIGMSLSEVLISLFLVSIIMTMLIQFYLGSKKEYLKAQHILSTNFDIQWVSDLLSDSIRRAGFTPCVGIDQLKTRDRRDFDKSLQSIKRDPLVDHSIQINRMSETFVPVTRFSSSTELILPKNSFIKEHHPIVIADCQHAEVHQILKVEKLGHETRVTVIQPVFFSYEDQVYAGTWLEEKWFIKSNTQGVKSLHYALFHTEELSSLIHSLKIEQGIRHGKKWIHLILGLDKEQTYQFSVAVRGS